MMITASIGNDLATLRSMSTKLGEFIANKREELGYSRQNQLAEAAGIKPAHLSQIESGKIKLPNAHLRRQIARALGISHLELLVAAGELTPEEGRLGEVSSNSAEDFLPPEVWHELRTVEWDPVAIAVVRSAIRQIPAMRSIIRTEGKT